MAHKSLTHEQLRGQVLENVCFAYSIDPTTVEMISTSGEHCLMIKSAQAPELQPAYSSAYDQTSTSRIPLTIVTTRATGTHSGEMGHQASVIKGHKFANFKLLATSGVATTTRGAIEDLLETTEIMAAKRLEGILKTKRGKSFRGKWVTEEIGGHGPGTKSG